MKTVLNRPNLFRLALFLYDLREPDRFSMRWFCGRLDGITPAELCSSSKSYYEVNLLDEPTDITNECGTVGCAIGWGPAAGIIPRAIDQDWLDYSRQFMETPGMVVDSSAWLWCFSEDWADVDNSPRGAAKRILWLLLRGLPVDVHGQRFGANPPRYLNWEPSPQDWVSLAQELRVSHV